MAKKDKRNKGSLIFLVILFLLSVCASSSYYFLRYKKVQKEYNSRESLDSYDTEYASKEEKLKEIDQEINDINSINVEELKKDYFSEIKLLEDRIISGESNAKIAYLTFDDGPYYSTYKFLDVLDEYNVKATFFTTNINGEHCYDNKSYNCQTLYAEYLKRGHTIANHTYTHAIWRGLYASVDSFMTAVQNQEDLIKEKTGGYVTNIVRFPGGSPTAGYLKNGIIARLREKGYGYVDWTAQDGDGGELNSTTEAWSNFKSSINQNIEVVLMHDYNRYTLAILPDAITYLRDKGYILLPLFYESNMVNK